MRKTLSAVLALTLSAGIFAAPAMAKPNEVHFGDLDLDTPAGRATLDARIRNAARSVCGHEVTTGTRIQSTCKNDVREQVLAQVDSYQNRMGKGG